MKKHSKLCAIFLTALLSISAVSFSVSAVGEEVDPGGDSSVIVVVIATVIVIVVVI